MQKLLTSMLVVPMMALTGATDVAAPDNSAKMLERISQLQGEWEGTYSWTGGRSGGTLRVEYYTTGAGSAVVENLIQEGKRSMSTVYHLDGKDLRMTHFCAAGNQPRLKAVEVDPVAGEARFGFIDATNIDSKRPGHVHRAEIRILDPENLQIEFVFEGGGRSATETIRVHRIAATTA
jgi:hypothetical protein